MPAVPSNLPTPLSCPVLALHRSPARQASPWHEAPLSDLIGHLLTAHHAPLREAADPLASHMERMAAEMPAQAEAARMLSELLTALVLHLDKLEQVAYPLLTRLERGEPGAYLVERLFGPEALALEADVAMLEDGLATMRMLSRRCPHERTAEVMRQVVEQIRAFVRLEAEALLPRALAQATR